MDPAIQFMLRVEREARAQRHPLPYRELMNDDVSEPLRLAKRESLIGRIFNPPRQRECG
ncbi:MAG: hypothetical protein KGZ60_03025 [Truepera sp.]|nr:hypothetical protein [Truepera sp.]